MNSNNNDHFSIDVSLKIILSECSVIYSNNFKDVNKAYVSIRQIVELTLKIILHKKNPSIDPSRESFSNLIIHMRLITDYDKDFTSFIYKVKGLGNDDAHSIADNLQYENIKQQLFIYLEWFFSHILKTDVPESLTSWREGLSEFFNPKKPTEREDRNSFSRDDQESLKEFDEMLMQIKEVEDFIELFNLTVKQKIVLMNKIVKEFGIPLISIAPAHPDLSPEEIDEQVVRNLSGKTYGLGPDEFSKLNLFVEEFIHELINSASTKSEMKAQILKAINGEGLNSE